MRIGASFNLPQLPQRPSSQTVVTPSTVQDKDSANRELPLRGQEAMQIYLTNAGFQFSGAKAELVGVDIYA